MIRTVWLAALCFGGVVAVAATSAGTSTPPPTPPTVEDSPEQTTVVDSFSRDTLTKADKLEIAYVRKPVAEEPIMPVPIASGEILPQRLRPTATQKIISPRPHAKKPATASSERRIKIREAKKSKDIERGKVTADLRPCRRPEGIAGLLRVFSLSPKCDS
jgi:hypothetical protein